MILNKMYVRQARAYQTVFKKSHESDKVLADLMLFCKIKKHSTDRDYFINIGRQQVLDKIFEKLDIDVETRQLMIQEEQRINKEMKVGE